MRQPSIVLGRRGKAGVEADVVLEGSKSISRRHARIDAVGGAALTRIELCCLGKHGVCVNGTQHLPGGPNVHLHDGDSLVIGGLHLHVAILPRAPTQQANYV